MIEEKDILHATHYGLHIYAQILSYYYPNSVVLELSGKRCKTTRNPFNNNLRTLDICNPDGLFCYQDVKLPEFKGNVFDFAALHYQLTGQELRQKINQELHLHIGEKNGFYSNVRNKSTFPDVVDTTPCFSFYHSPVTNILPKAEINIVQAWKVIKGSRYTARTAELRSITDPKTASEFKRKQFDYVTFSGVFSKRSDSALIRHSGLLTLDFDHLDNLEELRENLVKDELFKTALLFRSPSGDGLKWIIAIDLKIGTHLRWFDATSDYLWKTYHQEVDKSGKDISRACFLPHDPEVYINPDWLINR